MVGSALIAALTAAVIYSASHVWAKVKKNPDGSPADGWETLDCGKLIRTFAVGIGVGLFLEISGRGITQDRYDVGLAIGLGVVPLAENALKGILRRSK